jgi:outer membrane receptor protein involved in Fe transport
MHFCGMSIKLNVIKTVIFVFILSFAVKANAQSGNGATVSGTLIDAANNQPLGFATVSLINKATNQPKSMQTDINGKFNFTGIGNGSYIFRGVYIGYLTYSRDTINITPKRQSVHLGIIKLSASKGVLKEVTVTAQRSQIQLGIDKKSFAVDQSLVSQGGSATDLLANVPTVQVDADGNISLRGSSNVRVLINGKPSALTGNDLTDILQSIPASSIQTIEVITNPSSKYDAEGESGIINIVLKDNVQRGFTGSASATAGTHNSYNATLNLAYQNKKVNVYTNYSFRRADRIGNGYSDKTTHFANGADTLQNQIADQKYSFRGQNIRSGIDYNIDPKTTISFSDNINLRSRTRYQDGTTDEIGDGNLAQQVLQNNTSPGSGHNYDFNLDFDHKYKKQDEELTADIGYSTGNETDYDYLNTGYINYGPNSEYSFLQDDQTINHQHNWNLQLDYTLPLKNGKIDMGYRSTFSTNDNNYIVDTAFNTNPFDPDPNQTNDFLYNEQVHAIYTDFQHTFGKFSIQAGLRLEDARISTQLIDSASTTPYHDDYWRLYPSLFLTEKLSDSQTLQLSYSRRVTRPRGQQISPFLNTSNPLNYTEGNPYLLPQDTHSFELSYIDYYKTLTLTSSLYYRLTYDEIQQVQTYYDNDPDISLTQFDNVGQASAAGYELIAKLSPSNIFDLTGNLNVYYSHIAGDASLGLTTTSGYAWNGNLTANIKPLKALSFQLRGDYQAPQVIPQGKMYAVYGLDGGVRYDISKKLNVSVNARDLLNTRHYDSDIQYSNPAFNSDQYSQRRWATGIVLATISYRFGSNIKPAHKDKNQDQQQDQQDNGGGDDTGNGGNNSGSVPQTPKGAK